jgi:transaldolase/glucose-6-phosphate isomerase
VNPSPLLLLGEIGQSVWLVGARRRLLQSSLLAHLIADEGLSGIVLETGALARAIAGGNDYSEAIARLAESGHDLGSIARALLVEDAQLAADLLRPVFERRQGADGFVSVGLPPSVMGEAATIVEAARARWRAIDRPNIMLAVPATASGVPALRQLISEGISVHVTGLGGLTGYRDVLDAWLSGLEARLEAGRSLATVASVAGFDLRAIDAQVNPILDRAIAEGGSAADRATYARGQVAIAVCRLAFQILKEVSVSPRFLAVAAQGARLQRLLWTGMRVHAPDAPILRYVEALVAPETVAALDESTLMAYREQGHPAERIEEDLGGARRTLDQLKEFAIDLDTIARQAEADRFRMDEDGAARLGAALASRVAATSEAHMDRQQLELGSSQAGVQERIEALAAKDFGVRLWRKDASLWTADPKGRAIVANALGWLRVAEAMEEAVGELETFRREVQQAGLTHVVHMGMGGSSLAPLVFQRTLAEGADGLMLTVLDTTDPATILAVERSIPLERTLFIVASKSGTTAEPNAFGEYFFDKVKARRGERAGEQFVAITDPGTPLVAVAAARRFRRTFLNFPDIGGRYSALSYFGLLPAALMGADVGEIVHRARLMETACAAAVPVAENPGIVLGAALGELASRGRDKVTFLMPASIDALGMWLEQLIAESTGKEGRGLLPVAGEAVAAPGVYGRDRVFVHIRLARERDARLDAAVDALRAAGQPVITITMADRLDLAQEFYRWEIATATAGAVIGINAFDQPNVQESKDNTNRLLAAVRQSGALPEPQAALSDGPLRFYADGTAGSSTDLIAAFLAPATAGRYVALQAYLTETPGTEAALETIRLRIRDARHVATTVGYGPRYLHSTGQFHKGGPNTGLFLQLTADDTEDAPLPGEPYGFSTFKAAQALGDLQALQQHGRRAIRVHLGPDVAAGLARLDDVIASALEVGVGK